jgi:Carboxypeptidase regulatory-like domain
VNVLRGLSINSVFTTARTSPTEGTALLGQWRLSVISDARPRQQRISLHTGWLGLIALMFCYLVLGPGSFAHGQSTFGSVRGTVQDLTGAAIPGTQLVLHSVDENTDRTFTTDSSGNFLFENVKAGKYSLKAHHDGFADTVTSGIVVEARQDLRLSATLNVATQTTTVEVSAGADQINTENGTISDSKTNIEMTQLPLNNRATTTSPLGALGLSPNVQTDSSGNIALGGASSSMVNFSVDGISTANVRQNGALQDAYPSQEGIAGVKVTAFNNSAEFSQVGDVTFTTKSGTNVYHGSVFEYLQNQALDAAPYGFPGKLPKKFNTFGFSVSGPVTIPHLYNGHNKTFFFADYEGNRRSTATLQQFLVPSAADRTGNLSDQVVGTGCGGTNTVAQSAINPTAKALLAYIPLPNVPAALGCSNGVEAPVAYNYENFQPIPSQTNGADIRIDQTLGSKQSLYARFSRKNITEDVANPFLPDDADSVHNRSLLVSDTYTITPTLLNEFRYGFTNVITSVNFPIQGSTALSDLDLTGVNISQHPLTHAFPTFNFNAGTGFNSNLNTGSIIGRDKAGVTQSKTTQFSDNVSFAPGKHSFKAGLDIRRVRYSDLESFAPEFASDDFGTFVFQPTFTGNSFGDFLEGAPTNLYFAVSSPDVGGTATQYSFFGQDEFQVSSRLTLSYGLRWQVLPGFQEDGGNLANFDQRNNSIVVPDALAGYLVSQNITASNIAFQQSFNACPSGTAAGTVLNGVPCTAYITASQDHLPQSLRNIYKRDFQPRVSIAYRPFNDTKTVVRAGFGIYTMTNLGPLSFNNSGNPTSSLFIYSNSNTAGTNTPQIVFPNTAPPSSGGVTYGGGGLDQGVDPNYRDPQSNQWNVTIEREVTNSTVVRASYVGMHSYRLNMTVDLNQVPASTIPYDTGATAGPFVDNRAPYQNWTTLLSTFNSGEANYKAFVLEATRRMEHGLYFSANYTLAHNVADNQGDAPSAFAGEVNYGLAITDRFHIKQDLGNVEGTRRNRMLLTGVYQLPFGQGRAFMNGSGIKNWFLGGWDLTTITLLESGPWLTPTISSSADQSNTNAEGRETVIRPDVVSNKYYAGQSRAAYFNVHAFAPTPLNAGRIGNAGVGILQGPGTATVSLGVAKQFHIYERVNGRLETTFTNVLNRTNFAPPATAIDNSQFGALTAPQTAENAGNRTGQAALRIDF